MKKLTPSGQNGVITRDRVEDPDVASLIQRLSKCRFLAETLAKGEEVSQTSDVESVSLSLASNASEEVSRSAVVGKPEDMSHDEKQAAGNFYLQKQSQTESIATKVNASHECNDSGCAHERVSKVSAEFLIPLQKAVAQKASNDRARLVAAAASAASSASSSGHCTGCSGCSTTAPAPQYFAAPSAGRANFVEPPSVTIVEIEEDGSGDADASIKLSSYSGEEQMEPIMRLITNDLSEPYSIYTYRYFIHNWPHLCFLACSDTNEYVGAIVCKLDYHKSGVRRGYIAMLAVDEKYRRRQIGSRLVRKAITTMISHECDEVVLETEVTNKAALRLYERLGFVRDKRLFRYYLNGVDAFRLKLWLTRCNEYGVPPNVSIY